MNNQKPPSVWFKLLFAVVFGGVAIGILFGLMLPDMRSANIANNESITPVQATVVGIQGGVTINDVPHFRIRLDVDGINGEMRTGYWFTQSEANSFVSIGTVSVRVRGDRVAIVGTSPPSGMGFLWIFIAAFGAVGAGMLIWAVVSVIRRIKMTALLVAAGGAVIVATNQPSQPRQPRTTPTAAQRRKQEKELYDEIKSVMTQMENETAMNNVLENYRSQISDDMYFRLRGEMHYILKDKEGKI